MLKIYKDKVVIEGHEQTKEQCETMTLLANALKDSKDFKVVDYKNGYAEFEKVGKSNELKFAPASSNITINFDSNVTSVDDGQLIFENSGVTHMYRGATRHTFNVTLKEGYELDSVTSNNDNVTIDEITSNSFEAYVGINDAQPNATITITTKQSGGGSSMKSVDLTTLGGWNDLADGTHNITIVAKGTGYQNSEASDSVQVTKASGETWVLNEALDVSSIPSFTINFISNGENFTKIYSGLISLLYVRADETETRVWNAGSWSNQAYRTLVFDTAPTGDLLTWLQANGTKQ